MAQVFKLYRLQQLDIQVDQITNRIQTIEIEIQDQSSIEEIAKQKSKIGSALDQVKSEVKKSEHQVSSMRIKLDQNQAKLYGGKIKNPKELQDLQAEAATLRKQLGVLEDQLLEKLILAEENQEDFDQIDTLLNEAKSMHQEKVNMITKEKSELIKQRSTILAEREAIAETTPRDELILYEEIRNKRRGIAVVKVSDGSCSACGSSLSAALHRLVKSPNHIAYCETCGRILYSS